MTPPYRRPDLPVGERVRDLLARMTLTEKVGQLNQRLYGWRAWRRTDHGFAATEELTAEARRYGGIGALYGLQRADAWSGQGWATGATADEGAELCATVQRAIVAESRLGASTSTGPPWPTARASR